MLIGTNSLTIEQDTIGFWYLTDRMTGHYVSPPIKGRDLARNIWSRAESLLHGSRITIKRDESRPTVETVFDWAQRALYEN